MSDYNFPMDSAQPPGSALNARAMQEIRALIRKHPGVKMYIHCYLGVHRVGDVASMLIKWFDKNREETAVTASSP